MCGACRQILRYLNILPHTCAIFIKKNIGFKDIKYDIPCVMAHSRVSSHSTGPQIQDNLLTRRLGVPWTPFLLQAELHDFSWITSSNCSDLQHSWDRAAQVFLCPPVGKKPHIKCFHISGCMMKGITGSGHLVRV